MDSDWLAHRSVPESGQVHGQPQNIKEVEHKNTANLTRRKMTLEVSKCKSKTLSYHSSLYLLVSLSSSLLLLLATHVSSQEMSDSSSRSRSSMITAEDPCDFTSENFLHCQCDPYAFGEPESVEVAKCFIFRAPSPTAHEWAAISTLTQINTLEFNMRPEKILKFFIPSSVFSRMSNLSFFLLKMADVGEIPPLAFSNSTTLRSISLESNYIRHVRHYSFSNMPMLLNLNLRDNLILEINRNVFVNLPSLQQLILDQNNIRVIHDKAFVDLGNLEELDVHTNNLTVIARDSFTGLRKLRRLELRNNLIEFLGDHVFAEMPMLEEIDLTNNKIRAVSSTAFAGCKELGRLSLKDNKIVKLHPRTFESIPRVYFLDLRNNALETLEEELVMPIYDSLKNASFQLMIEGNRFICDCRILWIQDLFNSTESVSIHYQLKKTYCDLFQKSTRSVHHHHHHQHQTSHHSNSGSGFPQNHHQHRNNVTMVLAVDHSNPEETTSLTFDSSRAIMDLNARDFDCEDDRVTTLIPQTTKTTTTTVTSRGTTTIITTDSPVFVKRKKVVKDQSRPTNQEQRQHENQNEILSDTPSQSQHSRSLTDPGASSSASSIVMIRHQSYYTPKFIISWLTTMSYCGIASLFYISSSIFL